MNRESSLPHSPFALVWCQMNPVHAPPLHVLKIHLNIVLPHTPESSMCYKWSLNSFSRPAPPNSCVLKPKNVVSLLFALRCDPPLMSSSKRVCSHYTAFRHARDTYRQSESKKTRVSQRNLKTQTKGANRSAWSPLYLFSASALGLRARQWRKLTSSFLLHIQR